jgi:hypothetical protein
VEFDFEKAADYVSSNSRYKISVVNDQYEDQRPIETIVSGRPTSGRTNAVTLAANAAAKTTVATAASRIGATRPGLKPAMKTAVAQNKVDIQQTCHLNDMGKCYSPTVTFFV